MLFVFLGNLTYYAKDMITSRLPTFDCKEQNALAKFVTYWAKNIYYDRRYDYEITTSLTVTY